MSEFILHAGLHKTATTSLQQLVFPALQNTLYTGKSRLVNKLRFTNRSELTWFLSYCNKKPDTVRSLPLHTCVFYLSLIQDGLIAVLSRGLTELDKLSPYLNLMSQLLSRIDKLCPGIPILYSCEGLLLSMGHLFPELKGNLNSIAPLFLHKDLFPGHIRKIVIYLRSPLEYLFSRYIQIHTVRLKNDTNDYSFTIKPSRFLRIQSRLFEGPHKRQSVFYHVFQQELREDLQCLGVPVILRSYEKHIKDCDSISNEIKKAFGLEAVNSRVTDNQFKHNRLNSTDGNKDEAINIILSHLNLNTKEQLREIFFEKAENDRLVKAALSSRIYPF